MGASYSKRDGEPHSYWFAEGFPIALITVVGILLVAVAPFVIAALGAWCTPCSCQKSKSFMNAALGAWCTRRKYEVGGAEIGRTIESGDAAECKYCSKNYSERFLNYLYRINRATVTTAFPVAQLKVIRRVDSSGQFRKWEKTVVFAGREEPWEEEPSRCQRPFEWCGYRQRKCYIYFYFVFAMCLAVGWFVIVYWDSSVYRKTFTCNDVKDDDDYRCFNYTHHDSPVNCAEERNQNQSIICYIKELAYAQAIGIAFSFAELVILAVSVLLKVFIWLAEQNNGCGGWMVLIIQLLNLTFIAGSLLVYGVLSAVDSTKDDIDHLIIPRNGFHVLYYRLPARWAMWAWGMLSVVVIVNLSPWSCIKGYCCKKSVHYNKYCSKNIDLAVTVEEDGWKLDRLEPAIEEGSRQEAEDQMYKYCSKNIDLAVTVEEDGWRLDRLEGWKLDRLEPTIEEGSRQEAEDKM